GDGSILDARRAGPNAAGIATRRSSIAPPANEPTSGRLDIEEQSPERRTPCRRDAETDESTPAIAGVTPRNSVFESMTLGVAPSAGRTPISRMRARTTYDRATEIEPG